MKGSRKIGVKMMKSMEVLGTVAEGGGVLKR
jgi:hypothetical protein